MGGYVLLPAHLMHNCQVKKTAGVVCRRNELQALDLAITAFMSSLAFISMIGDFAGTPTLQAHHQLLTELATCPQDKLQVQFIY